jgi:bifunctional DNase/RNase
MEKIRLQITGLSYSQTQTGAYALVLGEVEGKRSLPIIIGSFEAQAIAIELEKMKPSRPLTHDVFKAFADAYQITIDEVLIYNLKEGVFFARLVCSGPDGEQREIDARTSDAIALAVRFSCPVYTFEFIMKSAGVIIDENATLRASEGADEDLEEMETPSEDLSGKSRDELDTLLQEAIAHEDYELASKIRDEIKRRKK